MNFKNICICGGGAQGTVIAGYLSGKGLSVSVLTSRPDEWSKEILVKTCDGKQIKGCLCCITGLPELVIPSADVVLMCLPGFLIRDELEKIKPCLRPKTYVGSVVSSTGFFFEALKILPPDQPLWGFQRVPFICRVEHYGHSARLLGYKSSHNIAVENVADGEKKLFADEVSRLFDGPVRLLKNYWEASLTNSNPILHTARLYSMFSAWDATARSDHNILFYEEWTDESSELLIRMDREFFEVLKRVPVSEGFLPPLLEYYESTDAPSLTRKIRSIKAFKGIKSPMKQVDGGWVPDFSDRYFTEDFPYGLKLVCQLAGNQEFAHPAVHVPTLEKVCGWGCGIIERKI